MKIIISRKGFDSGTGGCPSPILPDGRMFSLPIPGGSRQRYSQIDTPVGPMSSLVEHLTKGAMRGSSIAHLDPDLSPASLPRKQGWTPSLGQTGVAQSHLASKGVGPGDIFMFFGWFRPIEETASGWKFSPGKRDEHVLFGYLQVGEVLSLGARPDEKTILGDRPWLAGHPHLAGQRDPNNTLYIASPTLVIDGVDLGVPGGASFDHYHPDRVLTCKEGPKSRWAIPDWLVPSPDRTPLSYHGAPERWSMGEDGVPRLQTVAKGQEFVFDAENTPEASRWVSSMVSLSPPNHSLSDHSRPNPSTSRRRLGM